MNERPAQDLAARTTTGETEGTPSPQAAADRSETGFFPADRLNQYRDRWSEIQTAFVDDPKNAVQQAHGLVTEVVDSLVQTFSGERSDLEQQWSGGGNADTEALRVALQRYRDFFNRLLGS